MDDSALWKTEETIIGLSQLSVLSIFSRFGGCHLLSPLVDRVLDQSRMVGLISEPPIGYDTGKTMTQTAPGGTVVRGVVPGARTSPA
jgi:hypothetical protein